MISTVQLDREHATKPTVCWRAWITDLVGGGSTAPAFDMSYVYVPKLDAWLPDTVRLVLYELTAYLPAHDPADAVVRIEAKLQRPRGRVPKVPRPARVDDHVKLSVQAGGWRVHVETDHDDRPLEPNEIAPRTGDFSEPMQAFLLDLAAQSPFPLAHVRRELSAASEDERGALMPSRLNVQLGVEAPWDPKAKEWRYDLAEQTARVRQILDRLRNGGAR
jgi:hypothetical protein